ncbi:MAG: acetylornithine/succinylornithine family transaminase [Christensenellaceae bacterium]
MTTFENIKKNDEQHFMEVFGERLPAAFVRGEGVYLYDTAGKKYTDFLAGIAVNCLGYSDKGFIATIKNQVDSIIHTSNYFYNEHQAMLAQVLCEKTGYDRVFFGNSGAEANECALKLAKKAAFDKGNLKSGFVSIKSSFHGRTLATLFATGQDKFHTPYEPAASHFTYIEANDKIAATAAITADKCGVLLEAIQGEGGVIPLEKSYVSHIRELCDKNDVLLIIDEVQTGMGRTGTFLAQEQYHVKADITTLAKALGNGIPISACLAKNSVAAAFGPGDHGSTFGGNHLACAAGLYVTKKIDSEMLAHITKTGDYFKQKLQALAAAKPQNFIEVRGQGLLLALQLNEAYPAHDVVMQLMEKGFIVGTAGQNSLRFVPPYIIDKPSIDALTDALDTL